MKKFLFCLLFVFICFSVSNAQIETKLPAGALIIETAPINDERSLILWMLNPEKYPRDQTEDIYTCPEYTRGSFYRGKTQVSLFDSKNRRIINSVEINEDQGTGTFDIPYLIQRFYYAVPSVNELKEGKPHLLNLQDHDGDGKAFEFAMYEALACMGLNTALFGYNEKADKIIQYPVQLTKEGKTETLYWVDYLFSKKPARKGFWKYEIDYRGRGGSLDKYEIRYDPAKEMFVGNLISTSSEND